MIRFLLAAGLGMSASALLAAAPASVRWTPDLVHSRAEFTVSHMVLSKVWGHVPIRSITLQTPPDSVLPEQIDAVLDVTHEDTDNHDRDADLRSETYFDVARYPTMSFHSTKIVPRGPDDADVTGDVTIKNPRFGRHARRLHRRVPRRSARLRHRRQPLDCGRRFARRL